MHDLKQQKVKCANYYMVIMRKRGIEILRMCCSNFVDKELTVLHREVRTD